MNKNMQYRLIGLGMVESVLSAGTLLQKVFDPDGKSNINSNVSLDIDPKYSYSRWNRNVSKKLNQVSHKSKLKIMKAIHSNPKKEQEKPTSSFAFRKGFAVGMKLQEDNEMSSESLAAIFEEVSKAQPADQYLQGLYKSTTYKTRTQELAEQSKVSKGRAIQER